MNTFRLSSFVLLVLFTQCLFAQPAVPPVPKMFFNLGLQDGQLAVTTRNGDVFREVAFIPRFTLEQMKGAIAGTADGLTFDFGESFQGRLYYGFIPRGDSRYPHPVYFRAPAPIRQGRAEIDIIHTLSGIYDMVGWQESGHGALGYRVVDSTGLIAYDGIVRFYAGDEFTVAPTIIEGPFVNKLQPDGATISFTSNSDYPAQLIVGEQVIATTARSQHEIEVRGLQPATTYDYTVLLAGDTLVTYSFTTAPAPGSRSKFTFAYCSDSRSGQGGGERDVYGANFYIMKKILALASQQQAAFVQFTGDLIDGYLTSPAETELQYANWKRAVQPFWHHLPIYAAMGNHEALTRSFQNEESGITVSVDRFPFATESAEAVFGRNFVNPTNGPDSEDGAAYDPDPRAIDFPSYKENVFHYQYDNVAMVVLNSDYLYTPTRPPSHSAVRAVGGNIHGYILDNQLAWLEEVIQSYEADSTVDHIFVTQHTPCFPNGGHVRDDMWYNGDNTIRPWMNERPLPKGIIERRDQILDLLINRSQKVRAILTGDEHNYARTLLTPETNIYPEVYFFPRIEISRNIYQINNGAAGAPYYAQEETPWTPFVSGFTTQNALVLFHVDGPDIEVEVLNPDTLEEVDRFELR